MTARAVDPTRRTFVSYIDKSREYYLSLGYRNPYQWAHFADVPFAPLARELAAASVTLITTAMPPAPEGTHEPVARGVHSIPSGAVPARLDTDGLFWDRQATHTDDLDSYFPIHRLRELAAQGRIGRLAARLHCVPTEYSRRKTLELDGPEIVRRCREDGADAALLVPL
jgi:hypothetical protein